MSDIQEEQKRLYKRAEENDKEKWIDISKENRRLLKKIHNIEIKELQDRINKAIIYMQNYINTEDSMMCESAREEFKEIINILQGKEK